jgi:hypothetical protein
MFILGFAVTGMGFSGIGAVLGFQAEQKVRNLYGRVREKDISGRDSPIDSQRVVTNLGNVQVPRNATGIMKTVTSIVNTIGSMPEGIAGALIGSFISVPLVGWHIGSSFLAGSSLDQKRAVFEMEAERCFKRFSLCPQTSLSTQEWRTSIERRNEEIKAFVKVKGTFIEGPLRFCSGYIARLTEKFLIKVVDRIHEAFFANENVGLIGLAKEFCKGFSRDFFQEERANPKKIREKCDEVCCSILNKCRPSTHFLSWGYSLFLIGPVLKWIDIKIDRLIAWLFIGKLSRVFGEKLSVYVEDFLCPENMRKVILIGMEELIAIIQDKADPDNPKATALELIQLEREMAVCLERFYEKLEVPEVFPLLNRTEFKREIVHFLARKALSALYLGEDIDVERKIACFFKSLKNHQEGEGNAIDEEEFRRRLSASFTELKDDVVSFLVLGNREKDTEAFEREKGEVVTGLSLCVSSLEGIKGGTPAELLMEEAAIFSRLLKQLKQLPKRIKGMPGEEVFLKGCLEIIENISAQGHIISRLQGLYEGFCTRENAFLEVISILEKKSEVIYSERLDELVGIIFPGDHEFRDDMQMFVELRESEKAAFRGELLYAIRESYREKEQIEVLEKNKKDLLENLVHMKTDRSFLQYERGERFSSFPKGIAQTMESAAKWTASSLGAAGISVISEGERALLHDRVINMLSDRTLHRGIVMAGLEALSKGA